MSERCGEWVRASSVDDGPEDGVGKAFNLDGLEVAIFHWDQTFFAMENLCPHLGFPLTEGMIRDGSVICGWHGWRIRLDDGCCPGKTRAARTFPCEIRDDAVWVKIPERL